MNVLIVTQKGEKKALLFGKDYVLLSHNLVELVDILVLAAE